MKKKIILFFPCIILLLFFDCVVNSTTGIITIKNSCNQTINYIKLGNTLLVLTLAPGTSFNYYFYKTLSGTITSQEATTGFPNVIYNGSNFSYSGETVENGTFTLMTDYWFEFDITVENGKNYLGVGVIAQGSDNLIDPLNNSKWPYSDLYQP